MGHKYERYWPYADINYHIQFPDTTATYPWCYTLDLTATHLSHGLQPTQDILNDRTVQCEYCRPPMEKYPSTKKLALNQRFPWLARFPNPLHKPPCLFGLQD
jgi:hypothetical protein